MAVTPETIQVLEFEFAIAELQKKHDEAVRQWKANPTSELKAKADSVRAVLTRELQQIYKALNYWQVTMVSRHPQRPLFLDYVSLLFTDFIELHGDRAFGDDGSTVCGTAQFDGQPVMLIGQQKGRSMEENIKRNFGMPNPEAYRKAMRCMKLAEKFNRPIITFIDTPGAFPGMGGEERGQAEAIARNLLEMSKLTVPVISIVIGEGGSGGALGIGVANKVLMLEYAIYSVISPESCASILWRDSAMKEKAANALKNGAKEALELGIVDEIINEPVGGAHRDYEMIAANVKKSLSAVISQLSTKPGDVLAEERFQKFAQIGVYTTVA